MPKSRSSFVCQQCGHSQVGWSGKCPNCGAWNSMVETLQIEKFRGKGPGAISSSTPISLPKIPAKKLERISTKMSEFNRVLGGGLVPGQVVLIAGEPGIGKSTLILQVSDNLKNTFYASGEESAYQISLRANRLNIKNKAIDILESTDIDQILAASENYFSKNKSGALIIDSIQTMQTTDLASVAGSVSQVRECAFRITRFAKTHEIPTIIIGHVTKEGAVAGPMVLSHIVDSVLWFEGDKTLNLRLLRANKNRFGATDEAGIFEMTDKGLTSITNSDRIFLSSGSKLIPGSCVASVLQGTRPMLVEIQALVVSNKSGYTKKVAQGFYSSKLEIISAILTRRMGIPLYENDVFVSIAGGIKVDDPAIDLAICLSIVSSFYDKPMPKGTIAVGEVGLLGEVRESIAQKKRLSEAKRLGFHNAISSDTYPYLNQIVRKYFK